MNAAKIAIVDTYYPQFLAHKGLWVNPPSYERMRHARLLQSFGTADFYSRALSQLGWDCLDIVANDDLVQQQWAAEHGRSGDDIVLEQVAHFGPHVVFAQDLSFFSLQSLVEFKRKGILLAGQCSCALTDLAKVRQFDLLFTSFPHYLAKFESLGVHGAYLPLAFDPVVLERTGAQPERDIDVLFVGGLGHQWDNTVHTLTAIAAAFPEQARFYGYGFDHVPQLRKRWLGEAWGIDMYKLLRRAKIVLNRHGAISQGYSNNLRLFEATGCGALVLTEDSANLDDFFTANEVVRYRSAADAVEKIRYFLANDGERVNFAFRGAARTLCEHTYSKRMPRLSAALELKLGESLMHHPV